MKVLSKNEYHMEKAINLFNKLVHLKSEYYREYNKWPEIVTFTNEEYALIKMYARVTCDLVIDPDSCNSILGMLIVVEEENK